MPTLVQSSPQRPAHSGTRLWLASLVFSPPLGELHRPPLPRVRTRQRAVGTGPLPKCLAQLFPNKLTLPTRLLGLGGNSWPEACFPLFNQTGTCHMCLLVTARGTTHLET